MVILCDPNPNYLQHQIAELWTKRRYDTREIAIALNLPEPLVDRELSRCMDHWYDASRP